MLERQCLRVHYNLMNVQYIYIYIYFKNYKCPIDLSIQYMQVTTNLIFDGIVTLKYNFFLKDIQKKVYI